MSKIKRILAVLLVLTTCFSLLYVPVSAETNKDSAISEEELLANNAQLSRQVATEGMVLLKNDNQSLPLKKGEKIAIFGEGQINFVKGGGGSGDVKAYYIRNLLQGFEIKEQEGKVSINNTIADKYRANTYYNPSANDVNAAASAADTAIVVIRRTSGEGSDRRATKGDYYLSDSEVSLIERVCNAGFDNVSIVLNIGGVMDLSWVEKYPAIDSVLLAWQPGMEGGLAVADVMCGDVNPSGKLTDTFAKDYNDYPSAKGFSDHWDYVDYSEDIYVGYRYFETFDPKYEKVLYEFGYGLSYTNFRFSNVKITTDDENVNISVDVTNTGNVAGKEVVQVYFSAPQGKLGKPGKELAAYAKTDLLAPGETQTVKLSYAINDMSSYDDLGKVKKSAYVMEAGNYEIYVGNSVKDAGIRGSQYTYTVAKDLVADQLTEVMKPIQLNERLLANGQYEKLETYETMEGLDFFTKISNTQVTRIEAEDFYFKHNYNYVRFSDDLSTFGLLIEVDGENRPNNNRWVTFAIDVPKAGSYKLSLAIGNNKAALTDSIKVFVDNVETSALDQNGRKMGFPSTGGNWNIQEVGPVNVNLPAGRHFLKIEFTNGNDFNGILDYIKLQPGNVATASLALADESKNQPVALAAEENPTDSTITFMDLCEDVTLMDDFLAQMTVDELVTLQHGHGTNVPGAEGGIGNLPEYYVPAAETCDGPAGINYSKAATAWPIGTLVACTWNVELVEEMGQAFAAEAEIAGVDILLTPGMNIHRNPLCGRNFEYYSEDPTVTGKTAAALTRGMQTEGVGATLKHFIGNQREYERGFVDARVSERALREIYLRGFEIAVKEADPWCIMTSYNRVNGFETASSSDLLTTVLRGEWGYDGVVMTDWWNDDVIYRDTLAGGDVQMGPPGNPTLLAAAINAGLIDREVVEASAARVLKMIMKTNAADRALNDPVSHTVSATGTTRIYAVESTWKHSAVGMEACTDGNESGFNTTNTWQGRWLRYYLDVEEAGQYFIKARVGYPNNGGNIMVSADNVELNTIINDGGSNGYQDWKTTSAVRITLPAGRVDLRLDFLGGVNLYWFELEKVSPDLIKDDVIAMIQKLPAKEDVTFVHAQMIEETKMAYDALGAEYQAKIPAEVVAKLNDALAALAQVGSARKMDNAAEVTALSGPGGTGGEGYPMMFDGKTGTKFGNADQSVPFVWMTDEPVSALGYSITTGADSASWPGRNPKTWTLYGCTAAEYNGGNATWHVLSTVTNDNTLKDVDSTEYLFEIPKENVGEYQYYKLEVASIGGFMQMDEVTLYVDDSEADSKAAQAVMDMIDDLRQITSVKQMAAVEAAREAYESLTFVQKIMVNNLNVLEAAEADIDFLKSVHGDVDMDGRVTAADLIRLKALILANEWSDEELMMGDLNNDGKLNVMDIMLVKSIILNQ